MTHERLVEVLKGLKVSQEFKSRHCCDLIKKKIEMGHCTKATEERLKHFEERVAALDQAIVSFEQYYINGSFP